MLESLEPRQLLASNFLQGTVFLDSGNGTYQPGEELGQAIVTLYRINVDLSLTEVGHQTTGLDGNYQFNGLGAGSYRLIETPPTGDVNSATQTNLSVLNQVVAHTTSSIDVKIGDPGTSSSPNWFVTWPTNSQNSENITIHSTAGSGLANIGQYDVKLNESDISYQTGIFPTDCVDLARNIKPGDSNLPYGLQPLSGSIPASSYSKNASGIAYLYNKYLAPGAQR